MKKPPKGRKAGHGKSVPPRRAGSPPVEVTLDGFAWGGRAVGRVEGKVFFVSRAVPGDKLLVRLTRATASYAEADPMAVLKPSPDRVDPRCKFFSHCGGCQWLSTAYPRQAVEKERLVTQSLRHHLEGVERLPLVEADPVMGYRHRGDFHARPDGDGVRLGFYQAESHRLVNLDECLFFDKSYNLRYRELRALLRGAPLARGLEGLTLDRSEEGEHFAAHLRLGRGAEGAAGELVALVMKAGLGGALATPVASPGEVIASAGVPATTFALPGSVTGAGRDFFLRADVRSFTQACYGMNARLVGAALAWLEPKPEERFLDLYSGGGNFTLPLATRCREVVAVEGSPSACADARENALAAGLTNIVHREGEAAAESAALAAAGERFDGALLDPPRAGAPELIPHLVQLAPGRILYISCNLPALERDLGMLAAHGYKPVRVQAWDLFPQTYSVETMVLLTRS